MRRSTIDLHLHTKHSDGNWSPAEMVAHAVRIGMTAVAVTDHDTVSGIEHAENAASIFNASAPGDSRQGEIVLGTEKLEIIPGVEINSVWTGDDGKTHDIHVLGYFMDRDHSGLRNVLSRQRQARIIQVEEMIERLAKAGVNISLEQVEKIADGSPLGKVHVTNAIVLAGGARDVSDAYERYYDSHSKTFIPRKSVSPHEAVQAIVQSGGVSSIAHPGDKPDVIGLIEDLARNGLDGIEAYHRMHSPDAIATLAKLAERLGLIVTGGSDCHGPFGGHESLMGTMELPLNVLGELKKRSDRKRLNV